MPVKGSAGTFGDLLVTVNVKFPPYLNGRQLEIAEQAFPE